MEQKLSVQEFIDKLKAYAQQDFPQEEVTGFLRNSCIGAEQLAPFTFFSKDGFTRNLIYEEKTFAFMLLCWEQGQKTPIHDHFNQRYWLRVEKGVLCFDNFQKDAAGKLVIHETIIAPPGFVDTNVTIHAAENCGDQQALSLDLFVLPTKESRAYDRETGVTESFPLNYYSKFGKRV